MAKFTGAFWLVLIELAFCRTFLGVFVRRQILDYRSMAKKFPIPPRTKV